MKASVGAYMSSSYRRLSLKVERMFSFSRLATGLAGTASFFLALLGWLEPAPVAVFLLRIKSMLENAPFLDLIDSRPARALVLGSAPLLCLDSVLPPSAFCLDSLAPSEWCCLDSTVSAVLPLWVCFMGLALGLMIRL